VVCPGEDSNLLSKSLFMLHSLADSLLSYPKSYPTLRKATETSYFKGPDAIWVKLVIPTAPTGIGMDQFGPLDTQASITVSR
jgi:hypothetical protein